MTDERQGLPSASEMYRLVSCAGSFALINACPMVDVESEVAKQGTEVHKAMETGDTLLLDEESLEIAEDLQEKESAHVAKWCEEQGLNTDELECHREARLWVRDRRNLHLLCSAQMDVYYADKRGWYILTIDYKTGFLPVTPAERNWQLKVQALCLWHEYPDAVSITVGIAASRLGRGYVDAVVYTVEDLQHAERELLHQLWRAQQPGAPRYAGDWCRYCKAKAFCQEAAAWTAVDVVSPTRMVTTKEDVITAVAQMTPEQVAAVWRKRNIVEGVLDAIKARLKALPPEELETLGLKLKEGKKMREIVDKEGVYYALIGKGFSDIDLFKTSKPSIPNLVKHLQSGGYKKPEAEEIINESLAPYINESRGEPTLEEI